MLEGKKTRGRPNNAVPLFLPNLLCTANVLSFDSMYFDFGPTLPEVQIPPMLSIPFDFVCRNVYVVRPLSLFRMLDGTGYVCSVYVCVVNGRE